MSRSTDNPWLHRLALLTVLATIVLIGVGGLVTSHGAGMAVPDWPTTYGYNMFLFPLSGMVGGILYEHSHRLVASGVGLLTAILALWLWLKESRRWVRWLGLVAFVAVVLQGILGGLRVTLLKDELGIFHATLAQSFFVLLGSIALVTSRRWAELVRRPPAPLSRTVRHGVLAITAITFLQLILGSTMRHQHAGLAVPDFPLAYGKIWPPTDTAALQAANQKRLDVRDFNPITAAHIYLHMAHRITGVAILAAVVVLAWAAHRQLGSASPWTRFCKIWLGLMMLQAALGAATVWSNKAADVATMHVVVGALNLLAGTLLFMLGGLRERTALVSALPVHLAGEAPLLLASPNPARAN